MLIDLREQLATDVLTACSLAAHQTFRGGNDVDAIAAEHFRNIARADIHAPTGRRDALQVRDRRRTARVVAQEDPNGALQSFAFDDEVVDVTLFLQNTGNLEFEL